MLAQPDREVSGRSFHDLIDTLWVDRHNVRGVAPISNRRAQRYNPAVETRARSCGFALAVVGSPRHCQDGSVVGVDRSVFEVVGVGERFRRHANNTKQVCGRSTQVAVIDGKWNDLFARPV